jgi:serine/threonine-protein kinase
MQYLEGDTLDTRLRKGALPLDQALQYAIQIGGALERAHRAGVVHRDLKPGNIMLTKSGAKLLDFGLAKSAGAVVSETDATSLASPSLTAKGTILGTCQYMAPEQLEGREADTRTDVFALGSVAFEMVTGTKAFNGTTPANLVSAILKDQPPAIASLQPLTPAQLDHVVARCLAKDPDDRWQDVGDLTRELVWVRSELSSVKAAASVQRPRGRWLTPSITGIAGLAVGLATAAFVCGLWSHRSPEGRPAVTRALMGIAPAERLQAQAMDAGTAEGRPSRTAMAWSPDGRSIAFTAISGDRQMLYLRPLEQPVASAIAGTDGASSPFFSPDGRWIGFWSNGRRPKGLRRRRQPADRHLRLRRPQQAKRAGVQFLRRDVGRRRHDRVLACGRVVACAGQRRDTRVVRQA